jgi:hypothetical protein
MKTELMEYLDHLTYYIQEKHSTILQASLAAVNAAKAGDLGKLNRLFFDFPFFYDVTLQGECRSFCVVSPAKRERWIQKYESLIAQGDFELTYHNGQPRITASPETATKVAMFLMDILITACVDLLDQKGAIKPEIAAFFGLQGLLAQHQAEPLVLERIVQQMIYSYWLEIVNVNLGMIAVNKDCNVVQLECLNGFSKALLWSNKAFTPFFAASLAEYQAKYSQIDFAAYLKDLPVDRISGVVTIEMHSVDDSEDIDR